MKSQPVSTVDYHPLSDMVIGDYGVEIVPHAKEIFFQALDGGLRRRTGETQKPKWLGAEMALYTAEFAITRQHLEANDKIGDWRAGNAFGVAGLDNRYLRLHVATRCRGLAER